MVVFGSAQRFGILWYKRLDNFKVLVGKKGLKNGIRVAILSQCQAKVVAKPFTAAAPK
jgi:hypothetical protein